MKIKRFNEMKQEFESVIQNSDVHPEIKEELIRSMSNISFYYDGDHTEWESDFMFAFIVGLNKRINGVNLQSFLDEDLDYDDEEKKSIELELQCYDWSIRYFYQYLNDLQIPILTESGVVLYDPNSSMEDTLDVSTESLSYTKLDLTTDSNIINQHKNLNWE